MRRLASSRILRSKSKNAVNKNSRSSCSIGSSRRRNESASSTSRASSSTASLLSDSRTTSTDYTNIKGSQGSTSSSQLNTSDYNSISEASSTDISTNSFVSIDANSDDSNDSDLEPQQLEIPIKRESRARTRYVQNNGSNERQSRATNRNLNQRAASVAGPEDRLRRKVEECIRTTLVPIKENQTVIENDAGFQAQQINISNKVEWNRLFPPKTIVIYTDGSCLGDRVSGFGIYHGPSHELNRAYKIEGPEHNSGFAEIAAATTALNDLRFWNKFKSETVIIRSDYLPLIQAMQHDVQNEGNRFSSNYSLLQELCAEFPNGVFFQHVYAHDLEGDAGNDAADEFARQAVEYGAPVRSRSKSADVNRNKKRDRSQERGRSASRNNDRTHIRSHSAFVPGTARR